MRACDPDLIGTVDRDGVNIFYEVYENDGPSVVLVPTWNLFDSRAWKMQIPYLSRLFRVVTYDPRGNGRSDRPAGPENHSWRHYIADLVAVMDVTETARAVMVGFSFSGYWSNVMAIIHPERVLGVVAIGPGSGLGIAHPERTRYSYTERLDTTEGWAKDNVHFIRDNYREYVEFFVSQIFTESHSTKQTEDGIGWGMQTDAEQLISSDTAHLSPVGEAGLGVGPSRASSTSEKGMRDFYSGFARPLLIIHGEQDAIVPLESSRELARITGGRLVIMQGCGHAPNLREPVKVNLLIRDFVERVAA